jgi:rhamnosyltransferase
MLNPYQSKLNEILAVMVSYKVGLSKSETFTSLTDCLKAHDLFMEIIVYDNSPEAASLVDISSNENWSIIYVHDKTNPGVSKAYNTAFSFARGKNKKWILLLDQDTSFPENALPAYIESLTAYPCEYLFAPALLANQKMISPCRYYFKRGFRLKNSSPGIHSIQHKTILNSGMCISVKAFEELNGYNERIRLYFSDLDFIERYGRLFSSFCLIDLRCNHKHDNDSGDIENVSDRFRLYCEGARQSSQDLGGIVIYSVMLLFRSIKYSVRYKTNIFISIYLRSYILKR